MIKNNKVVAWFKDGNVSMAFGALVAVSSVG